MRRAEILNDWPAEDATPAARPPPTAESPPGTDDLARSGELASTLAVIAIWAERLRVAGVRRVEVGSVRFEVDARIDLPAPGARGAGSQGEHDPDPLGDDTTYPSGRAPRLRSVKEMFGDGDET